MELADVLSTWTHWYHVTSRENRRSIARHGVLVPSTELFAAARVPYGGGEPRQHDVTLEVAGERVVIRNQRALDPTAIEFVEGETLATFLARLDSRTYFWPGTADGLTGDGLRMLHADAESSMMIRIDAAAVVRANRTVRVDVSICNSGATWSRVGRKCRRSADVFQPLQQFIGPPEAIVEVSFAAPIALPRDATYVTTLGEPWRALFSETTETAIGPFAPNQ